MIRVEDLRAQNKAKGPKLKPNPNSNPQPTNPYPKQVVQWELGMEWRLSQLGKESDTELMRENSELAREHKWLVAHQEADKLTPSLWAWFGIVVVLVILLLLLFCLCLR
jgi:hypothetical protein